MQPSEFFNASGYLSRGWEIVRYKGLRRFVIVPIFINMMVFSLMGWLLYRYFSHWIDHISWLQAYRDTFLLGYFIQLLHILLGFLITMMLMYTFTLFANLIGAPFNSLLADRVELHLTGRSPSDDPALQHLINSLPKTMLSEVHKLVYLCLWMVPLLLLSFVPVLNIVAPALLFAFTAWMMAIEYIDYPMGNHGHDFKSVKSTLQSRRSAAVGFGSMVAIFSAIPVINWVIMPVAVAGATALYLEEIR